MYCKGKHSAIAILETLTAGLRGFFAVKLVTFTPKRGRSRVKLDTKLVRPRGILGSRPNDPTPDFHARARISNRKVGSRGSVYGRQNQASVEVDDCRRCWQQVAVCINLKRHGCYNSATSSLFFHSLSCNSDCTSEIVSTGSNNIRRVVAETLL